jgi:RNA polymerase sigma factor (sigma-70 family)
MLIDALLARCVEFVTAKLMQLTRGQIHEDDCRSAAGNGVCTAYRSWRPDRGASLKTWMMTQGYLKAIDALREDRSVTREQNAQMRRFLARKVSIHDTVMQAGGKGEEPVERLTMLKDPEDRLAAAADKELVARILTGLGERERKIVQWYYLDGFTMKEVGRKLGLSESRMSQQLSGILEKLHDGYHDAYRATMP